METTNMEKNAEQEWKDKAEKDFDIGLIPASYLLGISDYKQALREAIDNERTLMQDSCRRYHLENFMHHTDKHYTKILELIETVTPKES